jgi:hypothetical protein
VLLYGYRNATLIQEARGLSKVMPLSSEVKTAAFSIWVVKKWFQFSRRLCEVRALSLHKLQRLRWSRTIIRSVGESLPSTNACTRLAMSR